MFHAVIMAGGSGTRFWPKSRRARPKQLIRLLGESTMIQETAARLHPLIPAERLWVITGADQAAAIADQLPQLGPDHLIAEPCPRDTAAAVGLAARVISGVDPEAWLVVLPADHVIGPIEAFQRSLRAAEETLRSNPAALVTFGIAPTRPETGYGYIRLGEEIGQPGGLALRKAIAFKEKPNSSLATQYLEEGSYVWNSGIFVWMASTICQELSTHCPELHAGLERIATAWKTTERDHVLAREFGKLPRLPIDKAVLEKSSEVYALEVPYRWSDVGDWRALAELIGPDELGNVLQGRGHLRETRETIVISDSEGTIATLGVEGLLIVQSGGVTLVARRERLDELKALVEGLDHLGLGDLA